MKWDDIKKKRENELAEKEAETNRILEEVKAKEKYIIDLEKQINSLPETLNREYQKGKKDAITDLEKKHKYQTELLTKDFNNTIDRQNDKIASLESELQNYKEANKKLQETLERIVNEGSGGLICIIL